GEVSEDEVRVMVWEGRPRLVPVLPAWDKPIRDVIGEGGVDRWVFRPGRQGVRSAQVTDFLHRGHTTELDVRPARMRTTWMLVHLQSGTPPRELLRIAGLENLAALDRVTRFLPARAPSPPLNAMPGSRTDQRRCPVWLVRHVERDVFVRAAYMACITEQHRLTGIPAVFSELRTCYPQIPVFARHIMLGYRPTAASAMGAWKAVRPLTVE